MKNHTELIVWKKGIELVTLVYNMSMSFPDSEKFGLSSQMRRCSVSIPSNIAEGFARKGNAEFQYFLRVAYGSTAELETQLIISKNLGFTSELDFVKVNEQLIEIRKMLNALIKKLSTKY